MITGGHSDHYCQHLSSVTTPLQCWALLSAGHKPGIDTRTQDSVDTSTGWKLGLI